MTTYAIALTNPKTGDEIDQEGIETREEALRLLRSKISYFGVVYECGPKGERPIAYRPEALIR